VNSPTNRHLQSLEDVRPLYILPADPLTDEVLIPAFQSAEKVDCMVGFFSSGVLATLAPGLATFLSRSREKLRLMMCPLLRAEDRDAIENAVETPDHLADRLLQELVLTEDLLQQHTLKCLTWLLRAGRIEIRLALMKDALFHPKVWLFEGEGHLLAAHGSSNMTHSGLARNIEQVSISRSWIDPHQSYTADKFRYEFERLWNNKDATCILVPLPEAVRRRLLRTYDSQQPPTEQELRDLYDHADTTPDLEHRLVRERQETHVFSIPSSLRYLDGPFAHQGDAVAAWCEAKHCGILEMATGSGKTIASMIAAYRLYESRKPLLIVVAAPYVPLVQQWCDEIRDFGLAPVNLGSVGGPRLRSRALQKLQRRLRLGLSDAEVAVVSHDTLCTPDFHAAVARFDCKTLLIADEVHNLGRASFVADPPEVFDYRLGLSATPVRQYDDTGTQALLRFFGSVVFKFTLEEAIGKCLVEYDYYVHPVSLSDTEMDAWYELTSKIKQNAWRQDDDESDEFLLKLMRDRRALLEKAEGKIPKLATLLDNEDIHELRHTLIYATDKGPAQLTEVNRILRERNVLYHQLTAAETCNRKDTSRIIRSFQEGEIQVLTAKRVLDEGVDIPQVCRAFILASTTVERQWVQRRGRVLRTCSAVGKTHAVIHDLLALPPDMNQGLDPDARKLVSSELRRAMEFARLARNAGRSDGPLALIDRMVDAAYL